MTPPPAQLDAAPHDAPAAAPDAQAISAQAPARRAAADAAAGRRYWRSMVHEADPERFEKAVNDEFADYDPDGMLSMPRRQFLRFAAASLALAGVTLAGCRRWPREVMAPYADRPEGHVPGELERYASSLPFAGYAMPCVVEAFDGRPIKIEGNRQHPWAEGATNGYMQAATLELYDPDRLIGVLRRGAAGAEPHGEDHGRGGHGEDDGPSPAQARLKEAGWAEAPGGWKAFDAWAHDHFAGLKGEASSQFYVLAEPMPGPTSDRLKARLRQAFPKMTWAEWSPFNRDTERAGLAEAFGAPMRPVHRLAEAQVIVTFDADPLSGEADSIRLAKDWAVGRRRADDQAQGGPGKMSRTYAVEPSLSLTGAKADHRLATLASRVGPIVAAVAAGVGVPGVDFAAPSDDPKAAAFVEALVDDLKKAGPKGVAIAGPNQPAEVHALCAAINATLGAVGKTVSYLPAGEAQTPGQGEQLQSLAEDLNAGRVDTLLVLGGNPAFDAPAELNLPGLLAKAKHVVRLSAYFDETARLGEWRLPMAHALECWGDGYACDGSAVLQQPLILPLGAGRSAIELLAQVVDGKPAQGLDLVKQTHKQRGLPGGQGFEKDWRSALHAGFVAGSAAEPQTPSLRGGYRPPSPGLPVSPDLGSGRFEASFRTGSVYDGRYANSGWLQEAPDPLTKVCWANPVLLAPSDAKALGVSYGDYVKVEVGSRSVDEVPVYVIPGQAPGVVILRPGQGRRAAGRVGGDDGQFTGGKGYTVGLDLYPLRTGDGLGFVEAKITKASGSTELPMTADHHLLDNEAVADWGVKKRAGKYGKAGKILKEASVKDYAADRRFAQSGTHGDVALQLYDTPLKEQWLENARAMKEAGHPDPPTAFNDPHAWAMTVDLTTCLGCNACVIACQAENNIPVVGERGVRMSREMQWLRIDTYFKPVLDKETGKADWDDTTVEVAHMPVSCVHCENAPCEQVCPVAATVHDAEGLNTMVYNRCIGTRYCSNNCPYKVRRFNYFDWHSKPVHAGWAKPWLDFPDTQIGDEIGPVERMVFNPDVTVRMRGVMEKCTYCVQRITRAKIAAKNEWAQSQHGGRPGPKRDSPMVRDGEIITACQSACTTNSIVFGNLNDHTSKVFQVQHKNPRAYSLLSELNSRPRTKHLALIRNPSPKLKKDKPKADAH